MEKERYKNNVKKYKLTCVRTIYVCDVFSNVIFEPIFEMPITELILLHCHLHAYTTSDPLFHGNIQLLYALSHL
jgi:hypothetical protein